MPSSSCLRRADSSPPETGSSESEVLLGFLNYLRDSAAAKLAGVPEEAARTTHVASGTTPIGLIRHLTHVERFMFLQQQVTHWESTFRARKTDTIDSVLQDYRDATARANSVIEAWDDLSLAAPRRVTITSAPSRRWVLTHMIEETGRHAGHLDILRELFDGQTGR